MILFGDGVMFAVSSGARHVTKDKMQLLSLRLKHLLSYDMLYQPYLQDVLWLFYPIKLEPVEERQTRFVEQKTKPSNNRINPNVQSSNSSYQ